MERLWERLASDPILPLVIILLAVVILCAIYVLIKRIMAGYRKARESEPNWKCESLLRDDLPSEVVFVGKKTGRQLVFGRTWKDGEVCFFPSRFEEGGLKNNEKGG